MKQTIEIEVPYGKKAILKDNKIVYEDINPQLPKTWEEFCNQVKVYGEYYIDLNSSIKENDDDYYRDPLFDRGILPSKEAAKQHLALMQLHQLRDCYRQRWLPTKDKVSFGITRRVDGYLDIDRFMYYSRFLSFQSKEIAQEFIDNFRDLIEQAGDLI